MNYDSLVKEFGEYEDIAPIGVRFPEFKIEKKYYDELDIPIDVDNQGFLRALLRKKVVEKGINNLKNKKEYYDRIAYELSVLEELGFVDYILLIWDIVNFAKKQDIPVGHGRGSAAGSLVLYIAGITGIDPIKYDLYFERFVSKARAKSTVKDGVTFFEGDLLPDVDIDFCYVRRQEIIKYIDSKFTNRTCKILTFGRLTSKITIKDVGKCVGEHPEEVMNRVSSMIPKRYNIPIELHKLEGEEDAEQFIKWTEENEKVFKIAKKLEGLIRQYGVHASGHVVCYYPLDEVIPIQKTKDGQLVSGYDMRYVSNIALKVDVLGLKTLTVIDNTCKQIGMTMDEIDFESPQIFEHLQDLNSPFGLFQIEADCNFGVTKKVKPLNMEELAAVVALARPGALDHVDLFVDVKNGVADIPQIEHTLDKIIKKTNGVILYQELLMKVGNKVFGFTLDESEVLRRIVGKKKVKEMEEWKPKVYKKAEERGMTKAVADFYWKTLEDSANYSFNASHAYSYAALAAITTCLKFNHTKEFFLSMFMMVKHEQDPFEQIEHLTRELNAFELKLLPPDLHSSEMDFSIQPEGVRYGLSTIKGISEKKKEKLQEFQDRSHDLSKFEFFEFAKQAGLDIGVFSALIQAGTIPDFGSSRSRLVLEAQAWNLLTQREKRLFLQHGEDYGHDVLLMIKQMAEEKNKDEKGKPVISEKRFETIKTKYSRYKKVYQHNSPYEKFANWWYERKLLGFSYSSSLRSAFVKSYPHLQLLSLADELTEGKSASFIAVVNNSVSRIAKKSGKKYWSLNVSDETNMKEVKVFHHIIKKMTDAGRVQPKEDMIIIFEGKKWKDLITVESFKIMDEVIYMKLSEMKNLDKEEDIDIVE